MTNTDKIAYKLHRIFGLIGGLFILKDKNQKLVHTNMIAWYAHNGFLDKSLSYGIVGSLLYLALLLYASRVSWGVGIAMGVIALALG